RTPVDRPGRAGTRRPDRPARDLAAGVHVRGHGGAVAAGHLARARLRRSPVPWCDPGVRRVERRSSSAGPAPRGPGRPHNVLVRGGNRARDGVLSSVVLLLLAVSGLVASICLNLAAPTSGPGADLAGGPGWPYAALGLA